MRTLKLDRKTLRYIDGRDNRSSASDDDLSPSLVQADISLTRSDMHRDTWLFDPNQ